MRLMGMMRGKMMRMNMKNLKKLRQKTVDAAPSCFESSRKCTNLYYCRGSGFANRISHLVFHTVVLSHCRLSLVVSVDQFFVTICHLSTFTWQLIFVESYLHCSSSLLYFYWSYIL